MLFGSELVLCRSLDVPVINDTMVNFTVFCEKIESDIWTKTFKKRVSKACISLGEPLHSRMPIGNINVLIPAVLLGSGSSGNTSVCRRVFRKIVGTILHIQEHDLLDGLLNEIGLYWCQTHGVPISEDGKMTDYKLAITGLLGIHEADWNPYWKKLKPSMKLYVKRESNNDFIPTKIAGSKVYVWWSRISELVCIALSLPHRNSDVDVLVSEVCSSCTYILSNQMNPSDEM